MSVTPNTNNKLTWLLGLGLGLVGFSGFAAPVLSQQTPYVASRTKPRPIVADPKESQQTIQQYRRATVESPLDDAFNPVKAVETNQISRATLPNYQRSPADSGSNSESELVQQAGHHAHGPTMIDDPTVVPMGDSCDGCTSCGTGDCGGNCLSDCLPCNYWSQNGFYLGADYLYARVNYSEPTALFQRQVFIDNQGNNIVHDQNIPYELHYQSAYRVNAGYRWGSCGESLNFSMFNFNNNTSLNTIQANPPNLVIAGQLETNPAPGQFLWTGLDTTATSYDLDYSKRIPICSCNSDPCSCCDCPPWAITWNAGVRVGNINIKQPTSLYDANNELISEGLSMVQFIGAGPKVGIEGRRFFGDCYRWSAYGKSNVALLLGQYDVNLSKYTPAAQALSLQTFNYTRIVPVIDLEVGVSRQIGKKTLLTAGYFFQAWIDVSTVNTIQFVGNLNNAQVDDAHITSFDGFMLRLERTF